MRFGASLGGKSAASTSSGSSAAAMQDAAKTMVGNALEHSDNIVLVLEKQDDSLRIIAANKEAQRATGYSSEQLVGQSLSALLEKEEPGEMQALYAAAREGRAQRAELRCRMRTGQAFWLGLHLLPADQPATGRFVVLGHDITDKLRRESQEKAVQSLLAKVFVTVDAAVYITDPQGYIVMTNPALDRLIGVPANTLVGRNKIDLFAPACRHAVTTARETHNADGLDYSLDVTLLLHDKQEVAGRITVAMVQRTDASRFRIVTVRRDTPASPGSTIRKITAAGRIQLIGLDEVRESLGPRWPALKDRAMATAETVIRRRLAPNETFTRSDDTGFIVCFANASEEEAGFRAATIGNEIRQRLIGHGESPETAHVFAAAVDVPPDKEDLPAPEFAGMVKQRVGQRLRGIQETARTNLSRALEDAPYEAEPVYSRGTSAPVGWRVDFTKTTKRALEVAIGALPTAETATLDQDVMLLSFAQECLIERALQSPGLLVFVTLSSDILLIRKRMEACLEACSAIAENSRKQLVLAVAAPDEGSSRQINNGLPRLRPFSRFVGVAVERLETKGLNMREAGIALLVVDANALDATTIRARVDGLRLQQCQLMAYGADPSDMARLLREGVTFVSLSSHSADPASPPTIPHPVR